MAEYNVVIVGDRDVGKSACLKKLLTGEFEPNHIMTDSGSRTRLVFPTNYGDIAFNVTEATVTSYITGNAMKDVDAIIGFCSTTLDSYLSLRQRYHIVQIKNPRTPLVACGNGRDLSSEQKQLWHQYYDVNAKSGYNCEQPFLDLALQLTGHTDLVFLREPAVATDHRVWDATDINCSVQRCM